MLEKGKKLLYLCEYQSLYGGNFIPSLMALEENLRAYDISCVYVFPREAEQREWVYFLKSAGKEVIFFDFRLPTREFIKKLTAIVKNENVSYVYSHFAPMLKVELFAWKNRKIRTFIHIHSDFSAGRSSFKNKVKNIIIYKLLSSQVKFFSVSKAFVNYNPKKISYIPNGLAINRIGCQHLGGESIRKKYGIKQEDILCEIFGWAPIIKGVDVAVNAVKILNERRTYSVKLAIVCGREMTIERMKDWIKLNTDCTGNEEYLIYWEPQEDVFSYHEAANILLSASRSEGFPYSILEMLSLGKRCVVSDIPGVAWTKKFENVFSFSTENSQKCAKALYLAINIGNHINNNLSREINEEYSIKKWTKNIVEEMNKTI